MGKINTEVVENFKSLQKDLKVIIQRYGTTISFICRETNIPRSTFDRKMKDLKFTADEMDKICTVINQ